MVRPRDRARTPKKGPGGDELPRSPGSLGKTLPASGRREPVFSEAGALPFNFFKRSCSRHFSKWPRTPLQYVHHAGRPVSDVRTADDLGDGMTGARPPPRSPTRHRRVATAASRGANNAPGRPARTAARRRPKRGTPKPNANRIRNAESRRKARMIELTLRSNDAAAMAAAGDTAAA